ncbi:MAG: hypothetical protein ACN4GZ_04820 [Acidimicrobiales bacterium]
MAEVCSVGVEFGQGVAPFEAAEVVRVCVDEECADLERVEPQGNLVYRADQDGLIRWYLLETGDEESGDRTQAVSDLGGHSFDLVGADELTIAVSIGSQDLFASADVGRITDECQVLLSLEPL